MKRPTAGLAVFAASFAFLYWRVIGRLVHDWATDDNYSHGFLIVPIALYFVWERRQRLERTPSQGNAFGLVIVLGSAAVLAAGTLGAELFLTRISMLGVLVGAVVFVLGFEHLKILAFPLTFLILMIPIPSIIFNQIAFPLQLLASRFGELTLSALDIPVLREGNVINLASTSLEVAEACSGIRSLVSLLTVGLIYSYFTDPRPAFRATIALATVPIAIVANGLRVAGTGVAAHYYGPGAAEGFFHTFSGWLLFVLAFSLVFALQRFVLWIFPESRQPPGVVADAA